MNIEECLINNNIIVELSRKLIFVTQSIYIKFIDLNLVKS